mgnify:CR=1 FL=1
MKKIFFKIISLIVVVLLSAGFTRAQQYCTSTALHGDWEYISSVQLESINNQSTSGLYQDFSTSLKATLYVGENYGMTINTEKYSSTDRLNVYIDWNGDKTFTSNELMPVVYTGVESKQGKGTYTIVVPATAAITTTRMRVVLYDSGSNHANYSNGCGDFDYGEVEDYAIEIKTIATAPEVDFFGDVTSIFLEGVVHFTDKSRLAPTLWKWSFSPTSIEYQDGTSESSQNPSVKFLEATNYSVTLEATNFIGTSSQTKSNYIISKNYSAPKQLEATSEGSHVNLTWEMPNVPAWHSYVNDISECTYLLSTGTDRGTLYDDKDFNFSFPITITQVSSYFYYSDNYPWTNNQFKYKIIRASDNVLLYESPLLTAKHLVENIHELTIPITINEPFIVAISTGSTDGSPSNMAKAETPANCHTVLWNSEDNKWELFSDETNGYELYTNVFISHDSEKKRTIETKGILFPRYSKDINKVIGTVDQISLRTASSTLCGYKLYRDDLEIATISKIDSTQYTDLNLADGGYNYVVKAIYNPSGISQTSNVANVVVDNSGPEVQLQYNNVDVLEGGEVGVTSNVDVNVARDLVFTIKNEGRGSLTIGTVTLDNSMFVVTEQPAPTIVGGDQTTFTIQFKPTVDGPQVCNVSFNNNDSNENPFNFSVKGIGGQDRWTWMVYMLEDGTGLDGLKDINEWEQAGSVSGEVNYIVLYDAEDDTQDGIWYVKKDAAGYNRTLISDKVSSFLGIDPNMSSQETLRQYLLWVKDHYPAQHYGLTMWDHGDGIFKKRSESNGHGVDKGFVGTMKLWQMSSALQEFVTAIGHKIDVVGFDVCLLGQIETAYQFKDLANYVIASEKTEPGDGWDYAAAFKDLSENSSTAPVDVAKSICASYCASYSANGSSYQTTSTQAVVSIEALNQDLLPALNTFADSLIKFVANYKSQIKAAKDLSYAAPGQSGGYDNPDHKDLGHFAKLLIADQTLPQNLRTAAQIMLTAYEKTVVMHCFSSAENANATGMKIWMPEAIMDAGTVYNYYTKPTQFLKFGETNWVSYLVAYQNPPATTVPTAIFGLSGKEISAGSNLYLTDLSLQSPNSWNWTITPSEGVTFANSTTAKSPNPVVTISNAGYYTIGLHVENAMGSDDSLAVGVVKVVEPSLDSPGDLKAIVNANNVNLNWGGEVMFSDDNFDSYSPFSLTFGSWKQVDNDKSVTYAITDYTWPNSSYTGSFITFDGTKTSPAISGWVTPSGTQAIACFDAATPPNNDWLISAKVKVKAGDVLSFSGCSLNDTYGMERIQVGISTTGRETTDFTIITANPYVEVPKTWTGYQYDLSAYAGQDIYFCVHVVSNDAWALFLDDFHVGVALPSGRLNGTLSMPMETARDIKAWLNTKVSDRSMSLTGSKIFRDGNAIANLDVTKTTYEDVNPGNGYHTYFIQMVYNDGTSDHLSTPSNLVTVGIGVTGVPIKKVSGRLQLFPNPTHDMVSVQIPDGQHGVLKIYDLAGLLVMSSDYTNAGLFQLNMNNLSAGIYMVVFQGENQILSTKLVVN